MLDASFVLDLGPAQNTVDAIGAEQYGADTAVLIRLAALLIVCDWALKTQKPHILGG